MRRVRHDPQLIVEALDALDRGESPAAVSRRLEVPYDTVRTWRRATPVAARRLRLGGAVCARCGGEHRIEDLDAATYAYLLGVYLGDGCIGALPRAFVLKVALDSAYPGIVAEVSEAIAGVRGRPPGCQHAARARMVTVVSYWTSWPCLFPQHGPGKKHDREITLTDWQREIVGREPGRLLRGLIQTDGWRGENRVTVKGRAYSYPRYQFSNRSDDIRRIFCEACDALGIAWRPWGRWNIGVSRKDAVARLDEHVGIKR